jgi:predicted Rossmann fold flavoprotein
MRIVEGGFRIAVVGGGPAGFMAALAAAEAGSGAELTVFDSGIPLATVLRTGGGRCNLTNASHGIRELAGCYPRGGKFLISAFSRFGPTETMGWFRSRGLPLVEEAEGRVFPRSGRAEDVRRLLETEARRAGIRVRARAAVDLVTVAGGVFSLTTRRGSGSFDRLVIATGGRSGHELAQSLGHSITVLAPSLTALAAQESWAGKLAGLTLRGAGVAWHNEGEGVTREEGDLLFTHRGISGPLAFRVSSRCAFMQISRASPLRLSLTAFPGTHGAELEARLLALLAARPRQHVTSAVSTLIPRALADVLVRLAGLSTDLPAAQLSREGRKRLAVLLEGLPLTIVGREKGTEMVTAGGVRLEEIDPRTMGSRVVQGLFFCGEVLDIDGFTGGYNLQAAWSTGRIAGLAAGR